MTHTHLPTPWFGAFRDQRITEGLVVAGVMLLVCSWLGWRAPASATRLSDSSLFAPQLIANRVYDSPEVVISQVYGGGGESGAAFRHDFIELFNRGVTTVNLTGWSVQYATARNIGWQVTPLAGTLAPGQYYLVRQATGGLPGQELPSPDANGITPLGTTGGRVALVRDVAPLSGLVTCPTAPEANGKIVDFVGYGSTVVCADGAAAPTPSETLAVLRRNEGCTDNDQNGADFVTGAPRPRNTTSPFQPCNGLTTPQADLVMSTITSNSPATQTSGASAARFAALIQRASTTFLNTQTSPASVPARGLMTFFITVRNNGPAAAANVSVTDTLPLGFANLQAAQGGQIIGSTVTWPALPVLARGASATFVVTATAPDKASTDFNTARCTADTYDPSPANNRSLTPVEVLAGARFAPQDVQLELFSPAPCQSSFNFEARLTNSGFSPQSDTSDAEFVSYLPPELIVSSCFASKGICRTNSGSRVVRWDGTIAVNETVTITFSVQGVANASMQIIPFCVTAAAKFDADNDGNNESITSTTACGEYGCGSSQGLGVPFPTTAEGNAQRPGSVLIYNLYTSNATNPERENTRISLTNTNGSAQAFVHLFFVNGDTCEVSDVYLCLTPNQTTCFLVSELDPGVTGYLVAVAVNELFGCPVNFNFLIGDADIKLASGHAATLGAEGFAALLAQPVPCDQQMIRAELAFDGVHYNRAPRTLAISNLASLQDGNSTLLVLNRIGGDLSSQVATLGKLAGLIFDDVEQGFSFSVQGSCQLRQYLSNNFPRTTPRFGQLIPSGQTGWLKLWTSENYGLLGAAINFNENAAALVTPVLGGRNLHKLTLTGTASFTMPLIKPQC